MNLTEKLWIALTSETIFPLITKCPNDFIKVTYQSRIREATRVRLYTLPRSRNKFPLNMKFHSFDFTTLHSHYYLRCFLIFCATILTLGLYRMLFLISQPWRWVGVISYKKFRYGRERILCTNTGQYSGKCSTCTNTHYLLCIGLG